MVASTTGASGSTCVPNEPRKSSVSESMVESSAPSRRIFQDVRLLRSAVARTSGDSSLVSRPTSQFLSSAFPATALRTSGDSSVESLTRMFGNGMVSARKTRSSTGVCALPATASSNAVARENAAWSLRSGSGRLANSLNAAESVECRSRSYVAVNGSKSTVSSAFEASACESFSCCSFSSLIFSPYDTICMRLTT